ncbi:hypothetical protein HDU78_001721 [Chytriomyces hyalinus]|nr:hypothetical protein HDU78_001721 [Chytriomyces hyalinus]
MGTDQAEKEPLRSQTNSNAKKMSIPTFRHSDLRHPPPLPVGENSHQTETESTPLDDASKNRTSRRSMQSTTSSSITNSTIREITETWTVIALKMKWSIIALSLNGILILFVYNLQNGLNIDIDRAVVANYGGVALELVLLICNIISIWSLEEAASCIFGYLLCQKSGFSLAVCGYLQTPSFSKLAFSQTLSLTSPSRKVLTRISFIWITAEALKLLTPFSAITIRAKQFAMFNDVSDCIYFVQDDVTGPVDRGWPTFAAEGGVTEYVFGSSLGYMRSEVPDINVTTAIYPPTLISPLNNGDTIIGLGFSAEIFSTCKCASGINEAAFVAVGVNRNHVNKTISLLTGMKQKMGITFGLEYTEKSIQISNVFSGVSTCGGAGTETILPLVCTTAIYNHNAIMVENTFMTDGTTASIAPDVVKAMEIVGPGNIEKWLAFGLNCLIEGPVSGFLLPPTVPGQVNPLLWWTTPNLIAIDRAAVEAGMETMYSVLFKGSIQRTYTSMATQCPRKNTLNSHVTTMEMLPEGVFVTQIMLAVQMAISLCSIAAFVVWFFSPNPIGPAVRATSESVYLMTLLTSSPHLGVGLNELCNAETYAIWQRLDVICRIGESLDTLEEEIGKIIVDKPSLVRPVQNGKKYY